MKGDQVRARANRWHRLYLLMPFLAGLLLPGGEPWGETGFANAAALQPHRAVYELELGSARPDSSVAGAKGLFEFEWGDACDGWTVAQRSRIRLSYTDGRVSEFGWTLNSWESKAGDRYRFFLRRFNQGEAVEELRGDAKLDGDGMGGVARYELPEEKRIELPPGTMFPTAHSLALLEALKAGNMPFVSLIFDGSGEEGLYSASAVLAGPISRTGLAGFESPLLDDMDSWHVLLAFFQPDFEKAEPEQEQSFRLFENGVVGEVVFHYDDFSLDGELAELEKLPTQGC